MDTLNEDVNVVRSYVDTGARWLDEVWPSWVAHLDAELLDITNQNWCVLGQLAHSIFGEKWSRLGYFTFIGDSTFSDSESCVEVAKLNMLMSDQEAMDRGFRCRREWCTCAALTREWRELIAVRHLVESVQV